MLEQHDESDRDETFKPSARDNNSTDTEYSSNLSDTEKQDRNMKKALLKDFKAANQKEAKAKQKIPIQQTNKSAKQQQKADKLIKSKQFNFQQHKSDLVTSKVHDRLNQEAVQPPSEQRGLSSQSNTFALIERIKSQSRKEVEQQNIIQQTHLDRLDQLLFSNGLKRVRVNAYGNCFFEAAAFSLNDISASFLREKICQHLDENMEQYIGFLLQQGSPEDELQFVSQYCWEIEQLKSDGYWSTKAGDFLPLALSNWSKQRVVIYTSKPDQPIIDIHPTVVTSMIGTEVIPLAYTAAPGISEHYDACRKMTALDPMSSDQNIGEDQIPSGQALDSNATCTNQTITTEPASINQTGTIDAQFRDHPSSNEHVDEELPFTAEPLPVGLDTIMTPQSCHAKTPKKDLGKKPSTSHQTFTPRKAAKFVTPEKKQLTRKRKAATDSWKKNIRKKLRLSGQEYTSPHSGKKVPKRAVKPPCTNCRFKCVSVFTEEDRQKIFDSFWNLGSYERQKDFVCSRIEEKKTRTYLKDNDEQKEKKRMVARNYSLETGETKSIVCKKFFRATLDIGEAYINHALKGKSEGHFQGFDNRGRHTPANKTPEYKLKKVREHIESFPVVDAHYTRKDSNRKFLGHDLNITKMYELYTNERKEEGDEEVPLSMYRHIFNHEYNFSFHVPKKDQCNLCTRYHRSMADGSATEELKQQYAIHQARKNTAREEKERDKQLAKAHTNIYAATFDLQAVLYTPCSMVSLMYYMRKFCCYNFTVFSLANLTGTCYVWTEVEGKRGSCEVATCLNLHLLSLPPTKTHMILYSDACGGQNRNQVIATCFLEAVETIPSISIIDHKFLESGHTHMECDSMHSAVEHAKKNTPIYTPYQWDTVLRQARRRNPYTVVPVRHGDMKDYKKVKQDRQKNVKLTTEGKKVIWNKIKWMRYMKSEPGSCFIKYDFEEEFQEIKVYGTKRGRAAEADTAKGGIPRKYKSKLPISAAKKKDLMQMCRTGVIPPEFHHFYESLPSSSSAPDKLGEPDTIEDESGNDTEDE